MITISQVIALAIKRTFQEGLINQSDLLAAEKQYIKEILTEDLYDNVIANPSSYYIDYLDSSSITKAYVSGNLQANDIDITLISIAAELVVTASGHNLANGDDVLISGNSSDLWNDLLKDQIFIVSDVSGTTFKLKSSLQTQYIKPTLAYYIKYDIFNELFVEFSERGAFHLNADHATTISNATRTDARNDIYMKALALSRILKDYIEDQVDDEVTAYLDYYDTSEVKSVHSNSVIYGGDKKRSNQIGQSTFDLLSNI